MRKPTSKLEIGKGNNEMKWLLAALKAISAPDDADCHKHFERSHFKGAPMYDEIPDSRRLYTWKMTGDRQMHPDIRTTDVVEFIFCDDFKPGGIVIARIEDGPAWQGSSFLIRYFSEVRPGLFELSSPNPKIPRILCSKDRFISVWPVKEITRGQKKSRKAEFDEFRTQEKKRSMAA